MFGELSEAEKELFLLKRKFGLDSRIDSGHNPLFFSLAWATQERKIKQQTDRPARGAIGGRRRANADKQRQCHLRSTTKRHDATQRRRSRRRAHRGALRPGGDRDAQRAPKSARNEAQGGNRRRQTREEQIGAARRRRRQSRRGESSDDADRKISRFKYR